MADQLSTKEQVETFISDRILESNENLNDAWAILEPFILQVQNAFTSVDVPDVPTGEIEFPEYNFDPSAISDVPSAPDTTIDSSAIIDPTLERVDVDTIEIGAAPTFTGEAPETSLVYTEEEYVSGLLDFYIAKLETDIQGGTGISSQAEQAIYDRARRRLEQDYEARSNEIRDQYASMGWMMPVGPMNLKLDQARREYERRLDDLNRDIVVQTSNLEQENRKIIEDGTSKLQAILVDLHNQKRNRLLDVAKSTIAYAVEVYNARVSGFKTLMEAFKVEADVEIARINAQLERNKTAAQTYAAELEAKRIDVTTMIEEAKAKADVYRSLVGGYEARTRLLATVEDVKLKEFSAKGDQAVKNAEILLKQAEVAIQAAMNKLAMQVEASKTGASVAAQIIASALNSVNTSASLGFSGSYSHGHSYDETKETPEGTRRSVSISYDSAKPDEAAAFENLQDDILENVPDA